MKEKGAITTGSGDIHLGSLTLESNPETIWKISPRLPPIPQPSGIPTSTSIRFMNKQFSPRQRDFTGQGPSQNRIKAPPLAASFRQDLQELPDTNTGSEARSHFHIPALSWKRSRFEKWEEERETSNCLPTRQLLFEEPRK